MMLFILCLTLTFTTVHTAFTTIKTSADLVSFANEVSSGSSPYKGSTVTLAADIDLSGVNFPGIGKSGGNDYCFRGMFEGNGHVIKNMKLASSDKKYLGFFNCLEGGSVKNLVIDSSCSVANGFSQTSSTDINHAAGIAGFVRASLSNTQVDLLNCVNMAPVTGAGTNSRIGGIAGYAYALSSPIKIINCVNTGDIVHSGTERSVTVGGIVGYLASANADSTSSVTNCVNMGYIRTNADNSAGIVGEVVDTYNKIERNYWLDETSPRGTSGTVTITNSKHFNSSLILSTGVPLVDELNNYVSSQPSLGSLVWYTASFNTNGGTPVGSRMILYTILEEPDTTTKVGHTFKGWYIDSSLQTKWTPSTVFKGDTILYAKWSVNQYTVSFVTGCDTAIASVTNDFGTTIQLQTLSKTGYTFNGWNDDKRNNFVGSYTMNRGEDVTLTAQWSVNQYVISFNTTGGPDIQPVTSDYLSTIPLDTPTRTGYTFTFWSDDKGSTFAGSYELNRAENVTLTAQWTPNQYVISFITNGGSEIQPVTSDYLSIIPLSTPTRTGYTFTFWTDDKGNTFTGSYIINRAENVILTAQWNANQYNVTFDVNGGDALSESESTKTVTYDNTYGVLPVATRTGHTFNGWFTEEGNLITSESTVSISDDHTLTAQWTINNYTLTFYFEEGNTEEKVLDFNESIEYPENISERIGYYFLGWNSTITRMPAEDVTIKALWNMTATEFVEIVFGKKDMTEKEISEIVSQFVQGDTFVIEGFKDDNEGIRVIVRFNDPKEAINFITIIEKSSEEIIKKVGFVGDVYSFSATLLTSTYLAIMAFITIVLF